MTRGSSVSSSLDPDAVARYLVEHRLLPQGDVAVEALAGGVSNDVIAVNAAGVDVVVKQALARLRVAEEWLATPQRIAREAEALRLAATIAPGSVPELLHLDRDLHLLVMNRASRSARTWKADLLDGRIDAGVASRVGELAGGWHGATADDPEIAHTFGDLESFIQLRIEPYHLTVAARHPELAPRLEDLAAELLAGDRRCCLVHGDLSPKNVLLDAPGLWVIDWEVAHFGNPVFDLGFVLCHLACKAVHRPADGGGFAAAGAAFLAADGHAAGHVRRRIEDESLAAHTAALMLARADGKSPVEYLDEPARTRLRGRAERALRAALPRIEDLFGD